MILELAKSFMLLINGSTAWKLINFLIIRLDRRVDRREKQQENNEKRAEKVEAKCEQLKADRKKYKQIFERLAEQTQALSRLAQYSTSNSLSGHAWELIGNRFREARRKGFEEIASLPDPHDDQLKQAFETLTANNIRIQPGAITDFTQIADECRSNLLGRIDDDLTNLRDR